MPMPEDFAFLEGEIEGMRQQLSTMLGRLDALQVQLDNARAQLDAQGNDSSLPSHYPIWREAMMPAVIPVKTGIQRRASCRSSSKMDLFVVIASAIQRR